MSESQHRRILRAIDSRREILTAALEVEELTYTQRVALSARLDELDSLLNGADMYHPNIMKDLLTMLKADCYRQGERINQIDKNDPDYVNLDILYRGIQLGLLKIPAALAKVTGKNADYAGWIEPDKHTVSTKR